MEHVAGVFQHAGRNEAAMPPRHGDKLIHGRPGNRLGHLPGRLQGRAEPLVVIPQRMVRDEAGQRQFWEEDELGALGNSPAGPVIDFFQVAAGFSRFGINGHRRHTNRFKHGVGS